MFLAICGKLPFAETCLIARLNRAARRSPALGPDSSRPQAIHSGGENTPVTLDRIAWLLTVLGCLVAVVILTLEGYYGYAGVTFAVAASAAINLT